ncbi:MAG: EAL domain-containing protein [Curvibacter sp.]|nr:EAL domain-containing protein [Curvibacter sp.]
MPTDFVSAFLTHRFLPAFWTAALYLATGWLSLQICIPPDYISLVFLPAGVALGLTLTRGAAVLPGVALGSLAVQWLAFKQASPQSFTWTLLVSPMGAALQAWLGAVLARRWAGYPNSLDTPGKVMLLLLGIGPIGCLVNATLSVPVLLISGLLPHSIAFFSWWTWWLGDSVGVALVLPIVLVFLGEPAGHWRSRRRSVAVPMLLAMTVVGTVIVQVKQWEEQRLSGHLSQYAQEMGSRLQRRLDAQADSVHAIAQVLESELDSRAWPPGHELTQDGFAATVQHWLDRYQGTQNFGWSPLVSQAGRPAYESRNGPILGRNREGQLYPAPTHPEYLPIHLIQPRPQNRGVLGLDVAVLPATAEAVAATRASGQARITEGLRLVQETGEQRGVVMYQAIVDPATRNFKGVLSAVFRMDDVLQAVALESPSLPPQSCLLDPAAPPGWRHLAGDLGCDGPAWSQRGPVLRIPVHFGGREWRLQVRADNDFINSTRDWSAWSMVGLSLFCVGLLGAFLLVITGQARRTLALVDQRTAELATLAHYDSLTGLPNRGQWLQRGEAELLQARRLQQALAVIFLDLDHFKHVNDTLGHALGDELLQAVSARLAPCIAGNQLLARIGGDEFVALLPDLAHAEDAAPVAERLRAALDVPLLIRGHEINLSVSMGIACYPDDGDSLDLLLQHADTAMYVAKEAGRNGYQFFQKEMNARVSQRMFLENNLRRALERQELFLVYQPQIDAGTGRCVGVEALVRWRHPEQGLISPDRFIPVAEDCGLIEPLGAWILEQACRQLKAWCDEGLRLQMAINISAMQFRKPGFVALVHQVLHDTGAAPRLVELEITETLLMQPLKDLDQRLGELAAMGLTFALDDFGTGYSSLGYLKRLPISRIKLDKSFVVDLPGDLEDEAVTRATLSMAKDLGLQCVAEGVETEAQRAFLCDLGCEGLQGYLFARPMTADDCREWILQHGRAPAHPPGQQLEPV